MVESVFLTSVVGSDDEQPFLVEILFTVFYSIPYLTQHAVFTFEIVFGERAVSGDVESVVGIPQIYPAKVGSFLANTFGSIADYHRVNVVYLQLAWLARKVQCVEVVAVVGVVDTHIVGLGASFADKQSAVVSPA